MVSFLLLGKGPPAFSREGVTIPLLVGWDFCVQTLLNGPSCSGLGWVKLSNTKPLGLTITL